MNEQLLHYFWQFCHFETSSLLTTDNVSLSILKLGTHNFDAGPDFTNSHIRLDKLDWHGDVELHVKSSDWFRHNHQHNERYNSVILHVVWEYDEKTTNQKGENIQCLELKQLVNQELLDRYQQLMNSKSWILCQPYFKKTDEFIVHLFLERLLIERLEKKSRLLHEHFMSLTNDWEAVLYQSLCHSVGLKINAQPMYYLSRLLPFKILSKHKNNLFQMESLLFGVAGFLKNIHDDYGSLLRKEFLFLKHKYKLEEMEVSQWFFMRLRPSSFPTVRIAQLAKLIVSNTNLFSKILDADSIKELHKIFEISLEGYWLTHYHFTNQSNSRKKSMGKSLINTIIINTICPLLFVYSQQKSLPKYQEKAIRFLQQIQAEKNSIIKKFSEMGISIETAAQSQALIQLKRNYCEPKKCLNCSIGNTLITEK